MIVRALFVLALAAPAALAQSPQSCPWLNAGTVASVLGADVTVTAHSDSNWNGSCRFLATSNNDRSVVIDVGKTDPHACGSSATPVAAIGNEAALCSDRNADRQVVQVLTGRVRDAWFVVKLAQPSTTPANSSETTPSNSAAILLLAEQVSGNLY